MSLIKKILGLIGLNKNKRTVDDKKTKVASSTVNNMLQAKEKAKKLGQTGPTKTLTVEQLLERIRNNIFFLENLSVSLQKFPQYLKYKNKVDDLKKQSEDSLRIVLRIDKKAPYYQSTMKSVVIHTNHIARLVNIPY